MSKASVEVDSAKAILSIYHQVNDIVYDSPIPVTKSQKQHRALLTELNLLREKYTLLQNELLNRDKKLAKLKNELMNKTTYMTKLQEDFENAIEQLVHRKQANRLD